MSKIHGWGTGIQEMMYLKNWIEKQKAISVNLKEVSEKH